MNWRLIPTSIMLIAAVITIYSWAQNLNPVYWQLGGIVAFGLFMFLVGVLFSGDSLTFDRSSPATTKLEIDGCVNLDGTCWEGRLYSTDGEWDFIDLDRPVCEKCHTSLQIRDDHAISTIKWVCPECETEYEYFEESQARDIIEEHFRRIWESSGEPYSLNVLDNQLKTTGLRTTPQLRWETYHELVDDGNVSLCCIF